MGVTLYWLLINGKNRIPFGSLRKITLSKWSVRASQCNLYRPLAYLSLQGAELLKGPEEERRTTRANAKVSKPLRFHGVLPK